MKRPPVYAVASVVIAMLEGAAKAGDKLDCAVADLHPVNQPAYIAQTMTKVTAQAPFAAAQKTSVCAEVSSYMFVDHVQCTSVRRLSGRERRSALCASNSECDSGIFSVPQRAPGSKPGVDAMCVTFENRSLDPGTATLTVELH